MASLDGAILSKQPVPQSTEDGRDHEKTYHRAGFGRGPRRGFWPSAFAGCQSPATEPPTSSRLIAPTTKVNQAVEELNTRLGEFDEAVAQESVVNMRNKATCTFGPVGHPWRPSTRRTP